jgi:hypothetical protein
MAEINRLEKINNKKRMKEGKKIRNNKKEAPREPISIFSGMENEKIKNLF